MSGYINNFYTVPNRDNPKLNNEFIGGQKRSAQKGVCVSTLNSLVGNV